VLWLVRSWPTYAHQRDPLHAATASDDSTRLVDLTSAQCFVLANTLEQKSIMIMEVP
jgi:hypothetical protein